MDVFAEYIAAIDNVEHRERTVEILTWVVDTFPQLAPRFAWKQPMFTDHGTFIIGFSVAKQHLSFAIEDAGLARFSAEIKASGYDHSKKLGRIPWASPVDYDLLQRMIAFKIAEKADCTTFWLKA